MGSPLVRSYYFHYIQNNHAGAQLIWRITTLQFTVCNSGLFCAWPVKVPYLLRAVLVFLLFKILACLRHSCLASVRPWRSWASWRSLTILVSTCPKDICPIVVVLVVTSIGRGGVVTVPYYLSTGEVCDVLSRSWS